jgi:hypothetical protein
VGNLKVTDMGGMFVGNPSFMQYLDGWVVGNHTRVSNFALNSWLADNDLEPCWYRRKIDAALCPAMDPTTGITTFLTTKMLKLVCMGWCSSLSTRSDIIKTYGGIETWNVAQIKDFSGLFENQPAFNGGISQWDVSQATNMDFTFAGATIFDQQLGNCRVSRVISFESTFQGASSFHADLNGWATDRATNMDNMFKKPISFKSDLSSWNTIVVSGKTSEMFDGSGLETNLPCWLIGNGISLALATHFLAPPTTPIPNEITSQSANKRPLEGSNDAGGSDMTVKSLRYTSPEAVGGGKAPPTTQSLLQDHSVDFFKITFLLNSNNKSSKV